MGERTEALLLHPFAAFTLGDDRVVGGSDGQLELLGGHGEVVGDGAALSVLTFPVAAVDVVRAYVPGCTSLPTSSGVSPEYKRVRGLGECGSSGPVGPRLGPYRGSVAPPTERDRFGRFLRRRNTATSVPLARHGAASEWTQVQAAPAGSLMDRLMRLKKFVVATIRMIAAMPDFVEVIGCFAPDLVSHSRRTIADSAWRPRPAPPGHVSRRPTL